MTARLVGGVEGADSGEVVVDEAGDGVAEEGDGDVVEAYPPNPPPPAPQSNPPPVAPKSPGAHFCGCEQCRSGPMACTGPPRGLLKGPAFVLGRLARPQDP